MHLSIDIHDNHLEQQIKDYIVQKHQKANDLILEALKLFFKNNSSAGLSYRTKDPKEISKPLDFGLQENNEELFDDIDDVKKFAKKLRDDAWR
jgi:spore coat protein CotH